MLSAAECSEAELRRSRSIPTLEQLLRVEFLTPLRIKLAGNGVLHHTNF